MAKRLIVGVWMSSVLSAILIVAVGCHASAVMAAPTARAVPLAAATEAPAMLRYLMPGQHETRVIQCPNAVHWTNVSAYRWNGRALGAQRWSANALRDVWDDPRGGRVTFDGITFRNRTRAPVLVAGWCD